MPLTWGKIAQHLRGEITLGLYSVNERGNTKWSVIDYDDAIEDLLTVQQKLRLRGIHSYCEVSRRGGHLWVWWEEPIKPSLARRILAVNERQFELYPCGDIPDEDGYGLLIRAPCSVHRYSGERYPFVTPTRQSVSSGVGRGQLDWLAANVKKVNAAHFAPFIREKMPANIGSDSAQEAGPIARWIAEHPIRSVISQYVALSHSGLGHCPWPEHHKHADKHRSFAVYDRTNKWWCFTSRQGGNSFDFLCQYFHADARTILAMIRDKKVQ